SGGAPALARRERLPRRESKPDPSAAPYQTNRLGPEKWSRPMLSAFHRRILLDKDNRRFTRPQGVVARETCIAAAVQRRAGGRSLEDVMTSEPVASGASWHRAARCRFVSGYAGTG